MQVKLHFMEDMIKRKMKYAEHVRGSTDRLEWFIASAGTREKMKVGAPRKTWMKDMCEWTGLDTYDKVKRAAEERENWRLKIGKYRYKVDKRKKK